MCSSDLQVKKDRDLLESIQKERRDTQEKINTKKGEKTKAEDIWKGLQKNKPVKPQPRQQTEVPTNTGGQIYSGKVFQSPSALRSAFPNKTDDQIRQLVTNGGGRFIE